MGVGEYGCGFEQPLHAMKLALNNSNPANAGFLRSDAALAVIFLTDEDDCSVAHSTLFVNNGSLGQLTSFRCTRYGLTCDDGGATPDAMYVPGPKGQCRPNDASAYLARVGDFVEFLRSLKTNPSHVIVASISGDPTPVTVEARSEMEGGPRLAHSCYWPAPGVAYPAVRLKWFLDQFPERNVSATMCQGDFDQPMRDIAGMIGKVLLPN
jgi:hypothetical protein